MKPNWILVLCAVAAVAAAFSLAFLEGANAALSQVDSGQRAPLAQHWD